MPDRHAALTRRALDAGTVSLRDVLLRTLAVRARSPSALALLLRRPPIVVLAELHSMRDAGLVARQRTCGTWHVRPTAPEPPRSDVHALPMLVAGPGERHPCRSESDCLGRHIKAWPRGVPEPEEVHCPPGCQHRSDVTRVELVAEAIASTDMGERTYPPSAWGS